MCYNCGCGMPEDDMGKGKISQGGGSLTEADFEEMGKKWGMTKEESKQNTLELLKRELEVKK